jgi:predicted  nucleic acid-binding Zn-ribbon protein
MNVQLQSRLDQLRQQSQAVQVELRHLEDQKVKLAATLERLQGAIQVLEELLDDPPQQA